LEAAAQPAGTSAPRAAVPRPARASRVSLSRFVALDPKVVLPGHGRAFTEVDVLRCDRELPAARMRGSGATEESATLVAVVAAPTAIAKPRATERISLAQDQSDPPSGTGLRNDQWALMQSHLWRPRIYGTVMRA